jgi:hypothetical protein
VSTFDLLLKKQLMVIICTFIYSIRFYFRRFNSIKQWNGEYVFVCTFIFLFHLVILVHFVIYIPWGIFPLLNQYTEPDWLNQ